jgi:hypothetical protein
LTGSLLCHKRRLERHYIRRMSDLENHHRDRLKTARQEEPCFA